MNKKVDMVDINKDYVKKKIKDGGYRYADIAKVIGRRCEGSLSGAISHGRIRLDELQKIARIVDFPYEEALLNNKPRAFVKNKPVHMNVKDELDHIIAMQKEINISLIRLLKEMERSS